MSKDYDHSIHFNNNDIESMMKEAQDISTSSKATPMDLEKARSLLLKCAKELICQASNIEEVIQEMGGHKSERY